MPTPEQLRSAFFEDDHLDKSASATLALTPEQVLARELGIDKRSSPQEFFMPRTLADVHQSLINMEKQAAASRPGATDDAELEKRAEAIARAEMEKEAAIQKTAAEYDAAGRIMARGFADEFQKCMAEIEKVGMEGFVAGQVENDLEPSSAPIPTTGMAPKQHNKELNSTEGVKGKLGPGGAPAIITVKSMQEAAQPTPRAAATDLGGGA